MIRVLITGKKSYIGQQVKLWLEKSGDAYEVVTISLKSPEWRERDLSCYDAVFHVAGIAHVETKGTSDEVYYKVNTDLPYELAGKAKAAGVSQFIFMSSMIVYGDGYIGRPLIKEDTVPVPTGTYGNSKLKAEKKLKTLEDSGFNVAMLRCPMVYGPNSKGNFPRLAKMATVLPLFPKIDNRRSMVYIDNLCAVVEMLLKNGEGGVYFPQNPSLVNVSEMVREIAKYHQHRLWLVRVPKTLMKIAGKVVPVVNKVFGDLAYEPTMGHYKTGYKPIDLKASIEMTEEHR